MDIAWRWAILVVVGVIFGVILALLRLIGLGIILVIMGIIFGVLIASQSGEVAILYIRIPCNCGYIID